MDERTLNDLLECSVCLDRLDTSSKVLPCQHTFCRKCLEVILSSRQELRCPECRVLVDIKIDDLPPNVLLMRILEGMKNAKTQQESAKLQNDNKIENALKLNEEQQQQIKLKQQQLLYYQQQQNKHKQKQQLQILHQQQQQKQIQQSQQQHTASSTAITGPLQQQQQQRRPLPHAFALYDFESNEPSDLHFKKGDIILLKRKVDINWFVGELNGVEGTFPTNYVQVVVPLPSPQCIALYDFKMGPNEEEGCLTFKKATLIHVLRRVDHNWAEGRIGSTIGIFPIAFVELNPLAKQLLDSFVVLNSPPPPPLMNVAQYQQQSQHQQNAIALTPEIPANQQATANNLNNLQQHSMPPVQQPPRNLPPIPTDASATTAAAVASPDTPSSCFSSRSSSSQTTISSQTNSTCSSTSNSLPSSPNESNPTSPQNSGAVRYRDCKDKRHSLNALLCAANSATISIGGSAGPSLSIVQSSNRHSAEILSIPSETTNVQNARIRVAPKDVEFDGASVALPTLTAMEGVREQQQQPPTQPVACTSSRASVLKTTASQQNVPPSLPWGYLALYPYKPRKSDELELKKGCVYVVTECCLDGWFKGKNWQDTAGVFPGNYVTPLRNRDQQQLMHQWKYVQNQPPTTQQSLLPNVPQTAQKLQVTTANTTNISHQPPELPPRQSPSSPVNAATINSSSVWSKPLGQTVESFFTRKTHSSANEHLHEGSNFKETREREKQKGSNSTPSASCAAVSLMKRLTHMKTRSKSPNNVGLGTVTTQSQQAAPSGIHSMDNPSFDDTVIVVGTAHMQKNSIHPVHVRSGSCPSQLLQSLPADLQATAKNNEHNISAKQQQHKQQNHQQTAQAIFGGSQRIKGCKERPQLSNARQPTDVTMRGLFNSFNNSSAQQQQQFTKCSRQVQQQQTPVGVNNITIHRKSQSLDANTIPGQKNLNHTQENGRNAAVEQNARESRFRCVVSYPPNSELELDLNVGDVIYVHRKQKNGWYKGTHARTNKTGLFPASFVEPDI